MKVGYFGLKSMLIIITKLGIIFAQCIAFKTIVSNLIIISKMNYWGFLYIFLKTIYRFCRKNYFAFSMHHKT